MRYIDKIKEKPQVQHTLKERVKSAPKELIRRGLDDGTERLLNTPPETVPLDRTNGALRPLKWCMVTAVMVH